MTPNDQEFILAAQLSEPARLNLLAFIEHQEQQVINFLTNTALDKDTSDLLFRAAAVKLEPYKQIKQLLESHQSYARGISKLRNPRV